MELQDKKNTNYQQQNQKIVYENIQDPKKKKQPQKQIEEPEKSNKCLILLLLCICLPIMYYIIEQYKKYKQYQELPIYLQQIPNISSILEQRLDQFQGKCSHNSYYFGYYYQQVQYNPSYPYQGGCSMLEFDISLNPEFKNTEQIYTLYINHDSLEENTQLLQTALHDLYKFHQDHPKHLPIFLTINLKSYLKDYNINFASLLQKIETQLKTSLSQENIYTPKNLLKSHSSLLQAVENDKYPKIQQLLGKFIVLLDPELFSQEDPNQQELLNFYNQFCQSVENSLMFPTLDGRLILVNFQTFAEFLEQNPTQNQIFFNMPGDLYESDYYYLQEEAQNIIQEAQKQNFITRVYTINDEEFYEYYKNQKVNFICTDAVFYNLFAKPFF